MELETSRMEEAEEIRERYELSMERIRAMKEETAVSAPFYDYFQKTADCILEADRLASDIREGRQARICLLYTSRRDPGRRGGGYLAV